MYYDVRIFRNVDRGGVALLSVLIAQHRRIAKKQNPRRSFLCVLLLRSAPVFGGKRGQRGYRVAINSSRKTNIAGRYLEANQTLKV